VGVTVSDNASERREPTGDQRLFAAIRSFPNSVIGIVIAAFVLWIAVVVYALSAENLAAADRSQIIYQTALMLAGLIGLPLAIWRSFTAHRQADAALGQLKATEAQLANTARQITLAEGGQMADRLHRGAEMIGSADPSLRAAGLATLLYVARDPNKLFSYEAGDVIASALRRQSNADNKDEQFMLDAFLALRDVARHSGREINIGRIFFTNLQVFHQDLRGFFVGFIEAKSIYLSGCQVNFDDFDVTGDGDLHRCDVQFGTSFGAISSGAIRFKHCRIIGDMFGSDHPYTFSSCDFSGAYIDESVRVINGSNNYYFEDAVPDASERLLTTLVRRPRNDSEMDDEIPF
jgi:hypothetical protein